MQCTLHRPIHSANVIYMLGESGHNLNDFTEFWGSQLLIERAGNGDAWFDRCQVESFRNMFTPSDRLYR